MMVSSVMPHRVVGVSTVSILSIPVLSISTYYVTIQFSDGNNMC